MPRHTVTIEPVVGFVLSSRGASPGPRQSIRYAVRLNTGDGYLELEDVQPNGRAWWESSGLNTVAAPAGSLVVGARVNGILQLHFVGEGPETGPCT